MFSKMIRTPTNAGESFDLPTKKGKISTFFSPHNEIVKKSYHDIVQEMEQDEAFKECLLQFEVHPKQLEQLAEDCYDNDDYLDYIGEKFANEIDNIEEIMENPEVLKECVLEFKFKQWVKNIKEFVAKNCLTELGSLKVIVIGTVGFEAFTKTAMVANQHDSKLNYSVEKFKEILDELYSANYEFKSSNCDITAQYAKQNGYMFINTCLTENNYDIINTLCCTEFVNRVINQYNKETAFSKQLIVLDFRLTNGINRTEIDTENGVYQDREYYPNSQLSNFFKISPDVKRFRFGLPQRWVEKDSQFIEKSLVEMIVEFQKNEICYIYAMKPQISWASLFRVF